MHERQSRPASFDLFAKLAELGDRLAAKSSPKMPQKHQQHWSRLRQFAKRLPRLCLVPV